MDKAPVYAGNRRGDRDSLPVKVDQCIDLIQDIRQLAQAGAIDPENILFSACLYEIGIVDALCQEEAAYLISKIVTGQNLLLQCRSGKDRVADGEGGRHTCIARTRTKAMRHRWQTPL